MMRLSEMTGRPVVDMDAAEKLGEIDDIVLDPEGRRIAGFIVSRGPALLGGGHKMAFSATAVHSVGHDAVTVRGAALEHAEGAFVGLPRRRDVVGRKIVGHSGKLYGHIHDVLIDASTGQLIGYAVDDSPLRGLEGLFGSPRAADVQYVRADADLRVGPELVVVPDESVLRAQVGSDAVAHDGALPGAGWQMTGTHPGGSTSVWVDQDGQPTVEPGPAAREPMPPERRVETTAETSYEELAFDTAPTRGMPEAGPARQA